MLVVGPNTRESISTSRRRTGLLPTLSEAILAHSRMQNESWTPEPTISRSSYRTSQAEKSGWTSLGCAELLAWLGQHPIFAMVIREVLFCGLLTGLVYWLSLLMAPSHDHHRSSQPASLYVIHVTISTTVQYLWGND